MVGSPIWCIAGTVISFFVFFGLVPFLSVCVILFMGSSLIYFSRLDINASSLVFLFFFCHMCSVVFVPILSARLGLFLSTICPVASCR